MHRDSLEEQQAAHWESICEELEVRRPDRPAVRIQGRAGDSRTSLRADLPFAYLCLACHGTGLVREGARELRSGSRRDDPSPEERPVRPMATCKCPAGRARAARWKAACEADREQGERVSKMRAHGNSQLRVHTRDSWLPAPRAHEAEALRDILGRWK